MTAPRQPIPAAMHQAGSASTRHPGMQCTAQALHGARHQDQDIASGGGEAEARG